MLAAPRPLRRPWVLWAAACLSAGCGGTAELGPAATHTAPLPSPPNLLVVLSDDQGLDLVQGWGAEDSGVRTPHILGLVEAGVRFTQAYASPTCTPTRAALMTGRHPRRTGLGSVIVPADTVELPLEETTLPEALPSGYATSAVGKWHLASMQGPSGVDHPNHQGFDWFGGTLANLYNPLVPSQEADAEGYYRWQRIENGDVQVDTRYATTATIDDAIDRIEAMPEPWLLYVALHAPHSPLDLPPDTLYSGELDEGASSPEVVRAMVEAMDTELGRLLDALVDHQDDTYVFFLSDNGSAPFAHEPPVPAKDTPREAGIRVPWVVTGPNLPIGASVDVPVHAVDLLPTLVELAGGGPPEVILDGRSLVPLLRTPTTEWPPRSLYVEKFLPNGADPAVDWRIARDDRFKYVAQLSPVRDPKEQLHDLGAGGDDVDLLQQPLSPEAEAAYTTLRNGIMERVQAMRADEPYDDALMQ